MYAEKLTDEALVRQYVHVVNRAVERHRDELPYKQILDAVEASEVTLDAGIAVQRDASEQGDDAEHFVLAWDGDTLIAEPSRNTGERTWWSMPREHLVEVVQNPKTYLESPLKLNLDWMRRALGLQVGEA